MTLYRNALRAFASRNLQAPKLTTRRFYTSLGDVDTATSDHEEVSVSPSESEKSPESTQQISKQQAQEKKSRMRSQLSENIRLLMRRQPHGLAAVVSLPESPSKLEPGMSKSKGGRPDPKSAMLVSSLNTVTMSPIPYISFNVKTPSATYHHIHNYGKFMVSGLDDSATAHSFVDKAESEKSKQSTARWGRFVDSKGRVESDCGGTWWMKCKYKPGLSSRVGDHMIIVGEVREAGCLREEEPTKSPTDGTPADKKLASGLVYLNGTYRRVGDRMPVKTKRLSFRKVTSDLAHEKRGPSKEGTTEAKRRSQTDGTQELHEEKKKKGGAEGSSEH